MNQAGRPKIVVLDAYALNPGDLSWDALHKLGVVDIYDRTPENLILARAGDAEAVFTNKTPLSADALRALKALRYVGVLATGYNVVDLKAANKLGITVTNIPIYGTASVAQFVFALLLELCHHVGMHSDLVHAGEWCASPDWTFRRFPLVELAGKTLGVIGFGRIGRQVAQIAQAMKMELIVTGRVVPDGTDHPGIRYGSIEDVLAASDVVSLHCPLLPDTAGMIDAKRLSLMKKSAFLINTSRGPLVVEQDLADALNQDRLAGAAVDVLSVEPPIRTNPLLSAKNCIVTPHIAWATQEARSRLLTTAIENLAFFLNGEARNVVSSI